MRQEHPLPSLTICLSYSIEDVFYSRILISLASQGSSTNRFVAYVLQCVHHIKGGGLWQVQR